MPAERGAPELLGCLVGEEEDDLEDLGEADVGQLASRRERRREVTVVEGAAEAGVPRKPGGLVGFSPG